MVKPVTDVHIVDKRHIDFIVSVIMNPPGEASKSDVKIMHSIISMLLDRDGEHGDSLPNAIGRTLIAENMRSVLYRHEDTSVIPNHEYHYEFTPILFQPTYAEIFEAISRYEHHSSACPDWENSTAALILETLHWFLIYNIPGSQAAMIGWMEEEISRRISNK